MITIMGYTQATSLQGTHIQVPNYQGETSDIKPTDCPNCSTFYDFQAKKLYIFGKSSAQWFEQ